MRTNVWSCSEDYASKVRLTRGINSVHIETLRIRNFRRLKDVQIDLASDISIFVGANNSGKTSASHALQLFTAASRERFSVHDFSAETWTAIDDFGDGVDGVVLPTISLDIWFHVNASDLHRVLKTPITRRLTANPVSPIRVHLVVPSHF
jgi:hypothetical protein